jgi:hypothetical protein
MIRTSLQEWMCSIEEIVKPNASMRRRVAEEIHHASKMRKMEDLSPLYFLTQLL